MAIPQNNSLRFAASLFEEFIHLPTAAYKQIFLLSLHY